MTSPDTPVKPRKPLWRRLLKWTFRVAIVLVVLGIATYAIVNYWASKTIHNEIARIRAAGEPLTFAELDALTPKVDRDQDAGPYYTAAAELANVDFETIDANYQAFFGRNAPAVTPEILTLAHRSLEQNRLALDLLDRGSALPGCNSGIDLQFGIEAAFPLMGKARTLLNVASLRSRTLAIDGQADRAADSVISSLGLMRMMDRQPVLIVALLQIAMLSRACDDARFILQEAHLTDAILQKLEGALSRAHLIQPRQIFIAERVFYLEVTRDFIALGPRGGGGQPEDPGGESAAGSFSARQMWSSLGITGRILAAKSLPRHAQYIQAASGDWPGIMAALQAAIKNPESTMDQITSSSLVKAMVLYGRCLSVQRSTLIAIQIERFRLAHAGQLPDSLDQLPNAAPFLPDPFTGKPLLYVKTSDSYFVYSAGSGLPEDSKIDRDKDPLEWSRRWGTHIRYTR